MNPAQKRMKKTRRKTPGVTTVLFKRKKPGAATCTLCEGVLHGVPRRRQSELSKLAKTEKRPERIFGGVLCGNCVADVIKDKTRLQQGILDERQVDLNRLRFVRMLK